MLKKFNDIDTSLLRCPCEKKSIISVEGDFVRCDEPDCQNSSGFLQSCCQPVLIDFERPLEIFEKRDFLMPEGAETDSIETGLVKRRRYTMISRFFKSAITIKKPTARNIKTFLASLPRKPKILVIGGGTKGNGTEELWNNDDVQIISIDVYGSDNTSFIADAHYLPFVDEAFDGILIQAVLEHVVDPPTVVSEIFRVLKCGGIVYSEIPFMQQVHEGAFDFTRYTLSGHRWLYRNFDEMGSGTVKGPAVVLAWSIRYAARPLLGKALSTGLFGVCMLLFKLTDKLYKHTRSVDGASETFFIGEKKKGFVYQAIDLRTFYSGMQD